MYTCEKFHAALSVSLGALRDTAEVFFPEGVGKAYKPDDFAIEKTLSTDSTEDNELDGLFDLGDDADGLGFMDFLDLIEGDLEATKTESNCAKLRVDNEVDAWAAKAEGRAVNNKKLPADCNALE